MAASYTLCEHNQVAPFCTYTNVRTYGGCKTYTERWVSSKTADNQILLDLFLMNKHQQNVQAQGHRCISARQNWQYCNKCIVLIAFIALMRSAISKLCRYNLMAFPYLYSIQPAFFVEQTPKYCAARILGQHAMLDQCRYGQLLTCSPCSKAVHNRP
jgi:hypothetical protein